MRKLLVGIMVAAMTLFVGAAHAYTVEDVDNSFLPYRDSKPSHPNYTPGMVINQDNVEGLKDILDPAMYDHVARGWIELQTQETGSLELHPNYIKTTRDAVNNPPVLTDEGLVENFVSGRAFPFEPDLNDPRAGEKMAWNYQYGYNWGDNAAICPFFWKYRDMRSAKIERQIRWCFHFLNWMHRVNQDPVPEFAENPAKLFRSVYAIAFEPFDLRNTQLLIHRYKNDLKRDDAWLYLGFQRRVRRLATGQITDAFLGTDVMIEDFEGYNNRVTDYNWKFLGNTQTIMPFYHHNDMELATDLPKEQDGYQYIDFHGYGGCFPKGNYELRKAYILEATPKDPNHPISKRVIHVDAQTYTLPRQAVFDKKGELWKSFHICQAYPDTHHPDNKGTGVSIDDCFFQIDVQRQHCTTGQFKGLLDPALNPPSLFTVQGLRKRAR